MGEHGLSFFSPDVMFYDTMASATEQSGEWDTLPVGEECNQSRWGGAHEKHG